MSVDPMPINAPKNDRRPISTTSLAAQPAQPFTPSLVSISWLTDFSPSGNCETSAWPRLELAMPRAAYRFGLAVPGASAEVASARLLLFLQGVDIGDHILELIVG